MTKKSLALKPAPGSGSKWQPSIEEMLKRRANPFPTKSADVGAEHASPIAHVQNYMQSPENHAAVDGSGALSSVISSRRETVSPALLLPSEPPYPAPPCICSPLGHPTPRGGHGAHAARGACRHQRSLGPQGQARCVREHGRRRICPARLDAFFLLILFLSRCKDRGRQ